MAQTINQIANRYEIISLVGQGGMADVYKAQYVFNEKPALQAVFHIRML